METSEKILKLIGERGQISASEIADELNISRQALYRHLTKLLSGGQLIKIGRPPKVFYALGEKSPEKIVYDVSGETREIIENNYLIITPNGERLNGFSGFVYWCEKHKLPVEKTAKEYAETLKKYAVFKKDDLIDGMSRMRGTFKAVYLDAVYYLDFYSIERFGKTKLGQMLLYEKQSQNKKLMRELIDDIKPTIEKLVGKMNISGVGYISPTVKRDVQFMSELRKKLNLPVKEVVITKIKTDIAVPQKTLNKLEDRIENAQRTFVVEETGYYDTILLLDDAVGSGATLNEIARKIKEKKIAKKVIGLAITGSFKGIDVISEV
jgi:DNA-binding transcriptional ArsR family regulator/hypoxanthine-guanine phosphoribosyltransferase